MENTKHCPYCGEEIKAEAKKCKHCSEWLIPEKERPVKKEIKQQPKTKEKSTPLEWGILLLTFISSLWLPILIGVGSALSVPDKESHIESIQKDVVDCIEEESDSWLDLLGGSEFKGIANLIINSSEGHNAIIQNFNKMNRIEVSNTWFWSTGKLYNRIYPKGESISFGMFGIVFPYLELKDIVILDSDQSIENFLKNIK